MSAAERTVGGGAVADDRAGGGQDDSAWAAEHNAKRNRRVQRDASAERPRRMVMRWCARGVQRAVKANRWAGWRAGTAAKRTRRTARRTSRSNTRLPFENSPCPSTRDPNGLLYSTSISQCSPATVLSPSPQFLHPPQGVAHVTLHASSTHQSTPTFACTSCPVRQRALLLPKHSHSTAVRWDVMSDRMLIFSSELSRQIIDG